MYRSHSPGNSVAVVPSPPSSFSPLGYHPRSPSILESDFGCDLPAKKPRLCYARVPSFPFEDYIQDIAALPSTDVTGSSQTPSPAALASPPAYSSVVQTSTTAFRPLGKFEDSDIDSGLRAFFQDSMSSAAMQSMQQGQMQQTLAAGQTSFDLPSTRTARKEDDYKLIIHQHPEEVS